MSSDTLDLIDEWGPEKVVCVSDRKSGMRGVRVIDNTARGMGKGGTRMAPDLGRTVSIPEEVYAAESAQSLRAASTALGREPASSGAAT